MDACMIVGNLLENALYATEELTFETRHIHVTMRMLSEEMLGISIDNTYNTGTARGRRRIRRLEGQGHGIGLVSVSNTVKKYQGTMTVRKERGLFRVDILMYRPGSMPEAETELPEDTELPEEAEAPEETSPGNE